MINFADLEGEFSNYESSKAIILPIAYEGTVTYGKGASQGPQAILKASQQLELYDEELRQDTYKIGIHTLDTVEGRDLSAEGMVEKVYLKASPLVRDEKFIVMLGGEHSLSLGMVKALRDKFADLSVLQLDAHADLRDEYEGTKYNHACVGRRMAELVPLTQVGVRSLSREEGEYIKSGKGPKVFYAGQITGRRGQVSAFDTIKEKRDWIEEVISSLSPNVYLTIDLDVLDPGIMPSVGTPEPGGLDWYETLQLLRQLAREKKIVGFDLVELAPQPGNISPDFLAAKLTYKLLGYIFH